MKSHTHTHTQTHTPETGAHKKFSLCGGSGGDGGGASVCGGDQTICLPARTDIRHCYSCQVDHVGLLVPVLAAGASLEGSLQLFRVRCSVRVIRGVFACVCDVRWCFTHFSHVLSCFLDISRSQSVSTALPESRNPRNSRRKQTATRESCDHVTEENLRARH